MASISPDSDLPSRVETTTYSVPLRNSSRHAIGATTYDHWENFGGNIPRESGPGYGEDGNVEIWKRYDFPAA